MAAYFLDHTKIKSPKMIFMRFVVFIFSLSCFLDNSHEIFSSKSVLFFSDKSFHGADLGVVAGGMKSDDQRVVNVDVLDRQLPKE